MSIYGTSLLFKKETTKYTDSVPTPVANGVRVEKGFIAEPTVEKIPYNPIQATMGGLKALSGRKTISISAPVLVRGSGVAGTAPEIGDLLQACGLVETVVALTSVTYAPTSTPASLESGTAYAYIDGELRKALGAVGNCSLACTINQPITATFTLQAGFDTAPTTTAAVVPTFDAIQPIVMTSADIITDGTVRSVGSFTLEFGNVMGDHYTTDENGYTVSDRAPTITISRDSVSTVADWNALVAGTEFSISATFGTVAGNIMTITATKSAMTAATLAERNERHLKEITFELLETTGDDQFAIAFT